MEASKFDTADMEGQFAKPDIFAKDGVTARMDNKFPFHPLERSEAKYELIDNSVTRDVIQRLREDNISYMVLFAGITRILSNQSCTC